MPVLLRPISDVASRAVWCLERRRWLLDGHVEGRLQQLVGGVADENRAWLSALDAMPDPEHLQVEANPPRRRRIAVRRVTRNAEC